MRNFLIISAAALGLSACATQSAPVAKPAEPVKAAAPAQVKVPQCWNGDSASFMDVGSKANISGVAVVCQKTSDGKGAQWHGSKH